VCLPYGRNSRVGPPVPVTGPVHFLPGGYSVCVTVLGSMYCTVVSTVCTGCRVASTEYT
jgi:hypothetical protein